MKQFRELPIMKMYTLSLISIIKRLFSFKGKISRKEFWIFSIGAYILILLVELKIMDNQKKFFGLIILMCCWLLVSLSLRRCRDLNKSWLFALGVSVPIILSIVTSYIPSLTGYEFYSLDLSNPGIRPKIVFNGDSTSQFMYHVTQTISLAASFVYVAYLGFFEGKRDMVK